MRRILLSKGELLTMANRQCETPRRGWVGVIGSTIDLISYDEAEAEAWRSKSDDTEVIDCYGMVIMPGLINTHSHISMTLLRNYADDMELMEWLTKYIWVFEPHLTPEDIYIGAQVGIVEMLLGGTTTFVDMYWKEYSVAKAVEELGIRAMLTESVLDGREALFTKDMDRLRAVVANSDSSRIMVGVGPHAPYTCSPATLKLAVDYASDHDLALTIHLSETMVERSIIEERYGGLSPLHYLRDNGAITPRTILAHSIYLTDDEIEELATMGASVAHNAQSNMKLASGIAPIAKMVEAGVTCSLATDGASSNNDLDMWEEMRTATLLQRVATLSPTALPAYEALWMATRGGAKAIGREGDLGALEVGMTADIIAIDTTAPHMCPRHNIISALVYSAKSADVRHVMVDGVMRVLDAKLIDCTGERVDIEAILQNADHSVERILNTMKQSL